MIFKRYGTTVQSVGLNFQSAALNEIGFRRDRKHAFAADDFAAEYERVAAHELTADAEGDVQGDAEQAMLDRLEAQILELEAGLEPDCVLVVDNGDSPDFPKTRQQAKNVIVEGENRLHFRYSMSPALRMGVYRKKA